MLLAKLTDAELMLLGLVSEMPRHGYELEQVIDTRGMREWTPIGFSSIYFVLGKLEKAGLVKSEVAAGAKSRKVFSITANGRDVLLDQTKTALATFRSTFSSLLLGMAHWPALTRDSALESLTQRKASIDTEIQRIERLRRQKQPMPDHLEVLFDFSEGQLAAERVWITTTLEYMRNKPWPPTE